MPCDEQPCAASDSKLCAARFLSLRAVKQSARLPRAGWLLFIGLLAVLGTRSAHAAGSEIILVLGVRVDSHRDTELTEHLERYLRTTERVVSARELHREEQLCQETSCLYDLAKRHGATMLIGADVAHISGDELTINLFMLNAASKSSRRRTDTVAPRQLEERLTQLVRQLMMGPGPVRERAPSDAPLRPARVQIANSLQQILASLPPRRVPTPLARKRVGIALLVAGITVVGAAAVLSIVGPRYNTSEHCFAGPRLDCIDRSTTLATSGYALGGSLALSGILSLTIPQYTRGAR